jgi:type I restriction enzyme, S subunit
LNFEDIELGEICLIKRGTTITQREAIKGDIPVVAGGLQPTYYHNKANRFNETITISGSGANAGYVNLWKQPIFASDCTTLEVKDNNLDINYVYYFLLSKQEYIYKELRSGAAQPHVYGKDISKLSIKFLPLSMQQKIVFKLDEVFAQIAKAVAANKANISNAEALFQSFLKVFECDVSYWSEGFISDICSNITDGKHGDCVNEENSGYYFLSAKDIKNGILNYSDARQITKEDFEETHRRTNLECGDVLITNSGTIGRMAIVQDNDKTKKTTFQKSVAILKPKTNIINSKFLFHLLTSKLLHFNKISAGAAQKNLLLRDIRSLKISYPKDLLEQLRISNNCDVMRDKTDKLINSYVVKHKELNLLRQSILKKTFDGESIKV